MPSLSAEKRAVLISATKNAAAAFLEDMQYLREVTARIETSRGELRRLSAVLRRLLAEGEIARIAAPRIGRINLLAPNNKAYYTFGKTINILYFSNSGSSVFGVDVKTICMMNLGPAGKDPKEHIRRRIGNFEELNQYETILLRPGNFLAQNVICYARQWISRGSVILYVANFLSGVHTGIPVTSGERLLERIRGACTYSIENGELRVHVLPEMGTNSCPLTILPNIGKLSFDAASLDPLLVEVLATANLVVKSPDVARLEDLVSEELSS